MGAVRVHVGALFLRRSRHPGCRSTDGALPTRVRCSDMAFALSPTGGSWPTPAGLHKAPRLWDSRTPPADVLFCRKAHVSPLNAVVPRVCSFLEQRIGPVVCVPVCGVHCSLVVVDRL